MKRVSSSARGKLSILLIACLVSSILSLAPSLSQTAYGASLFEDGFESGFGNWTAVYGTPSASTFRTHNGAASYEMAQDQAVIRHDSPSAAGKVAVVWFYDNAADTSLTAAAFADSSGSQIGLGVYAPVSATRYAYRLGTDFIATTITRTTGWHSLVFDYTSGTDVKLYMDQSLVAASPLLTSFTSISIGDFWTGHTAAGSYFDDIRIQDTVPWQSYVLPYTPAVPASMLFYDDFENGFANWTTMMGTPTVSLAQAHAGTRSYAVNEDNDVIQHNMPGLTNKAVVAWFYDDASDLSEQAMAFVDGSRSNIALGVNTPTTATQYVYRVGTTYTASGVTRTTGWHSLGFDYRSGNQVTLYIDGNQILTTTAEISFKRIALGDYWNGSKETVYFDDISVGDYFPWETFLDSFENGLGNWTASVGTASTSTVQAHSGTQSYVINEDTDVITHNMAALTNKAVLVWFYDHAEDTSAQALAFADGNLSNVALGVNTSTSTNKYVYRIGSTYTASTVNRTTGWHSFGFDYRTGTGVALYIDGQQVTATEAEKSFKRISLGDYWSGSLETVYYDDISIRDYFPWETAPGPNTAVIAPGAALSFEASGAWKSEAYLLEDNPSFQERDLLESNTTSLAALNSGVSLSEAHVKQGTYSGKWANHPFYPTISTRYVNPDWSTSNTVSFWVYSEKVTHENAAMVVFSDNPATYTKEFYHYTFNIDWTGWKKIEIPFAAFSSYGDTAGWNSIQAVYFSTKLFNRQPSPDTVLYLDDIQLTSNSAAYLNQLLLAIPVPETTVSYITKYPAGFESMSFDDYLLYVNNKMEYSTASAARQQELAAENLQLLNRYSVTADTYSLEQFVETRTRIAAVHDIVPFDTSVMNKAGAELSNPPPAGPIRYQAYWKNERALFGYNPSFNPSPVSIAPDGHLYIKYGDSIIQTYNSSKGKWYSLDIEPVFEAFVNQQLGWFNYRHRNDYAYNDANIRFDSSGDAYMLTTIQQLLEDGSKGVFAGLLLHSKDHMKTWQVYQLPTPFGKLENIEAHNSDALNNPPIITLHKGFLEPTDGAGYLLVPRKNGDGTLDLSEQVKFADKVIFSAAKHSGDSNIAVTKGNKVYLVYAVTDLDQAPPIPANHPASAFSWKKGATTYYSANGVPSYAVVYDLITKQLSAPVFIGYGGRAIDDHNWPVLSLDSAGRLHVFMNGHHDPTMYAVSTLPEDITSWSTPAPIGTDNSYASMVIDANDTIYMITRDSEVGYSNDLGLFRKKSGQGWEPVQFLVERFKSFYEVWNQKLALDPGTGKLYLTYYGQSRQSQVYKDEYDALNYVWPDKQALFDPEGAYLPIGTSNQKTGKQYRAILPTPSELVTLISDDGGDHWHLSTTADFVQTAP
ncbi:MAG: right-handed parallel beta-helix repeat-containing protein [Paenibacillaceae bacterium]|jgi:hypothetical protein|nr:right-handed parallel beta-helix repeat-containing protein [Paenibacillaceae bacterium]